LPSSAKNAGSRANGPMRTDRSGEGARLMQ
jgi:hypothetical protein